MDPKRLDPTNPICILLLLGELEGCYTYTKHMGFTEDNEILDKMKKKYYTIYFKLLKEEKQRKSQ